MPGSVCIKFHLFIGLALANLIKFSFSIIRAQNHQENFGFKFWLFLMGVGGAIEYFSGIVKNISSSREVQQYQTVNLHCKIDCEGCERKMRKAFSSLDDVTVEINRKQQKISVTGYIEAEEVLKKAKRTGLRVQLWQFVPYNLVPEPYQAKMYDKKAPTGFVRKAEPAGNPNKMKQDDAYLTMFSDDNTNGCSIM